LSAARRYADIARDAPHALDMPSHIFTRVGSWEESIATNMRSATVAACISRDDEAKRAMEEAFRYERGAGIRDHRFAAAGTLSRRG
jgi:hypothetical protein